MSQINVIVIHVRAKQAAEYEKLFVERQLPRWRDYQRRGKFISARFFRSQFGSDERKSVVNTSSSSRSPAWRSTTNMTPIPISKSLTGWPTSSNPRVR